MSWTPTSAPLMVPQRKVVVGVCPTVARATNWAALENANTTPPNKPPPAGVQRLAYTVARSWK